MAKELIEKAKALLEKLKGHGADLGQIVKDFIKEAIKVITGNPQERFVNHEYLKKLLERIMQKLKELAAKGSEVSMVCFHYCLLQ